MIETFNIVCNSSEFSALLAILKKNKQSLSGKLKGVLFKNNDFYYSVKMTYATPKTIEEHTMSLWCLGLVTGESSRPFSPSVFSNN